MRGARIGRGDQEPRDVFRHLPGACRGRGRVGLFRSFPADFFDLVIVDECHRGSARDESSWRVILEHFEPAVQLGMTATPLREETRDTYLYFGNPVYQYSLRQGIDDGSLAPYRVHRVVTEWDAAGWRPSKHELDRYGRSIPDDEYHTKDFERTVALRARTETIARHLTQFLQKTDRFAKTIVFCVDQEHASEMRAALSNLNSDLVAQDPNYVCRVTADEGDVGRGHLDRFQDVETKVPAILTTSQPQLRSRTLGARRRESAHRSGPLLGEERGCGTLCPRRSSEQGYRTRVPPRPPRREAPSRGDRTNA